jgi:hypothetical protein
MARELGIEVTTGDPRGDQPGQCIVIPTDIDRVQAQDVELAPLRQSYLRRVAANRPEHRLTQEELEFLAEDTRATVDEVGEGWERAVHHTQAPAGTEP